MVQVEDPPGFVVRTEAQKAAWDNGYRLERGLEGGWLHYASTTAPGTVWIAGANAHALLSQVRVIDTKRLVRKIGALDRSHFDDIRNAVRGML